MKVPQAIGLSVAITVVVFALVVLTGIFVIAKCCIIRLRSDQSAYRLKDLELAFSKDEKLPKTTGDEDSCPTELESKSNELLSPRAFPSEVESFDNQTNGLGDDESRYERMNLTGRRVDRLSAIKLVDYSGCSISTLHRVEKKARSILAHYYSLFDRSLIVQSMAQDVLNGPKAVKEIKDQHSSENIRVGGIVVVKKPFTGTKRNLEIETLEPGEMLRIVKFFIKNQVLDNFDDDGSSIDQNPHEEDSDTSYRAALDKQIKTEKDLKEAGLISPCPTMEPEVLEGSDPNFSHIWCSGVLLRTYLHHDTLTGDVSLKHRAEVSVRYEVVRDFPLWCVSLKSIIPKHESSVGKDTFEDAYNVQPPSSLHLFDQKMASSEDTVADLSGESHEGKMSSDPSTASIE